MVGAGLFFGGVLGTVGLDVLGFDAQDADALSLQRGRRFDRVKRAPLASLSNNGVKTRLGIMSDAHFCSYDDSASSKLARALETLGWAAPNIDAFFMLGDISLSGAEDELAAFASETASSLSAHFSSAPVMHLLMGNHDYWNCDETRFESFFASCAVAQQFIAEQNTVAYMEGATIIKLDGAASYELDVMNYTPSYDFLAAALEDSAVNRPDEAILVMAHEPPEHMSMPESYECGNYGQGTLANMVDLIAQYPQARMLTGHIHNPLDAPHAINTDLGFTSVHTSTIGSCLFVRGDMVDDDEAASQGVVLDIMEDNSLVLHRLDFTTQEYIGEPVAL